MLIALWIIVVVLALVFLAAGLTKALRPTEALAASSMPWAAQAPRGSVTAIGVLEVLGALGLVLPLATGIAPVLIPLAAIGLALTMVGAIILHVRRGESPAVQIVLLVLTALAAALGLLAL